MPEEGVQLSPKDNILTTQEILRLSKLFVQQGVTKIRLTGGEPTVRRDLVDIVAGLNELRPLGLNTIGMTTNGVALKRKLKNLREHGMDQVNVSLDTLDPFQFELMTRRRGFEAVMESITTAVDLQFPAVKINVVVINKVNSGEILDFIEMTRHMPVNVRFIEYMPFDGNKWNKDKFIPYKDMLETIKSVHPLIDKSYDEPSDTTKVLGNNAAFPDSRVQGPVRVHYLHV